MNAMTCPFCNAMIPGSTAGRVSCPRCGEDVVIDRISPDPTGTTARVTSPAAAPAPPRGKPIRANRLVGGLVLAVMLSMAGVGLWFALATVDTRRGHDKNLPRTSRRPALPPLVGKTPVSPVVPGRLSALGYMPSGVSLLIGLHVADLMDSPIAERFKGEQWKIGPVEVSLDTVETWLGIPAGNIDHLAMGSVLEPGGVPSLTPPTVLVIRTREAVGINRLREALSAAAPREQPTPEGGKRPISVCRVKDVPLHLWLPNPRTVVIGLFNDLAAVPSEPALDNNRIAPETRAPLEERLGVGTVAWLAASVKDVKGSPLLSQIPTVKGLSLDGIKAITIAVPRETPLRVQAATQWGDEAVAEKKAEAAGKVEGVKVARDKEWLTLQWSR